MNLLIGIRDAYIAPVPRASCAIEVNAACFLARVEAQLAVLKPGYMNTYHVVLANNTSGESIFLDAMPHPSFKNVRLGAAAELSIKHQVRENVRSLDEINSVYGAVGGFENEHYKVIFMIYKKSVTSWLTQHQGWPLDKIPGKIARRMMGVPSVAAFAQTAVDYAIVSDHMTLYARLHEMRPDACAACGKTDLPVKKCGGCKKVAYCGRECQVAHWREIHKDACSNLSQQHIAMSTLEMMQSFLDACTAT